jgi:hypothetical protein
VTSAAARLLLAADEAWRAGRLREALRAYSAAACELVAAGAVASLLDPVLLDRLAFLAAVLGKRRAAAELLQAMEILCRDRSSELCGDRVLLRRVQLAIDSGETGCAYELLDCMQPRTGDIFDPAVLETTFDGMARWELSRRWPHSPHRGLFFSEFYAVMGRLAARGGQYGLALTCYNRGLWHAAPASGPDGDRLLPLLLGRAAAWLESGEMLRAGADLGRAGRITEAAGHSLSAARCLELRAFQHLVAGEFGAALELLEDLTRRLVAEELWDAAWRASLNLATAQIYLLQTAAAKQVLGWVEDGAWSAGEHGLAGRARALSEFADWRVAALSRDLASSVLALRSGADGFPAVAANPAAMLAGGSFLAEFDSRAAELGAGGLDELRSAFGASDSLLIRTRLKKLEARRALAAGSPVQALAVLEETLPTLRALDLKPDLLDALGLSAVAAEAAGRRAVWDARIDEARRLLDGLAASLAPAASLAWRIGQTGIEEHGFRHECDQIATAAKCTGTRRWPLWLRIEKLLSHAGRGRATLLADLLQSGPPPQAPSRRRRPDRATVSFLVLADQTLTVCQSVAGLDFTLTPIPRRELREVVARWHAAAADADKAGALDADYTAAVERASEASRSLAERLGLDRLLGNLPDEIGHVVFIPDDALHGFPFAALCFRGVYLIERFAVSVDFIRCARRQPPVQAGRPLILAVTHGTKYYLAPVPVNDVRWMLSFLPEAEVLAGDRANRATLLEELPRASQFHAVCHGEFNPGDPSGTGLVLTGPDGSIEILSLRDLASLSLPHLRHVTLVACWGADAYYLPGRWVLSLPETFRRAGAGSVLASIWPLMTIAADKFVKEFYRHLAAGNRTEALRDTQLSFLRGQDHIMDWAGWQLYGEST